MRDPSERDDHADLWQGRQLRLEKWSAIRDFRRRRLVLGRQAFHAVDDDRAIKRQAIVKPRIISPPAQPELGKRRK